MVERQSTVTCPVCTHRETEIMPLSACQYFYECKRCGHTLRPRRDTCCVYCSHGTVPCPPGQRRAAVAAPAP